MRSRPDARRSRLETACRLGVFALIGWMLGGALLPTAVLRVRSADADGLGAALPAWTLAPRTDVLAAALDHAPARAEIAWLSALRHAGHAVAWSGAPVAAALSVQPDAAPGGGVRMAVAAPPGSMVRLESARGDWDSVTTDRGGIEWVLPGDDGLPTIQLGAQRLSARPAAAALVRPVLVVGAAGWESKFVAAALEESGWTVQTRFAAAPGVVVRSAGEVQLDTAHLSAIIAVDTTVAALGSAVGAFVNAGGGLVLAGNAARANNVASLAPGRTGERVAPLAPPGDTLGLASAGYVPVVDARADAEQLERESGGATLVARRVGAGRVLQMAYDETWRWRMSGGPGAPAGHRRLWSRLASAAAYVGVSDSASADRPPFVSAPLPALVDALGPARQPPRSPQMSSIDQRWLLAAILLLLLLEWGSRRLRGLR